MFTGVARHPLQLHRHIPDFLRGAVLLEQSDQLLLLLKRLGERHPHLKRDQLRHAVSQSVRLALNAGYVPHDRLGGHGAESDNLRDRVSAVGLRNIFDHFITSLHTEVDVKVGHRNPLWVEKSLEKQVVFNRVQISNAQRVSNQ